MIKYIIPDDLTDDQRKALDGYFNDPKKYFLGFSLEVMVDDFREVNETRRKIDYDKKETNRHENALFEMLHFEKEESSS
jgi:hypothetical protein